MEEKSMPSPPKKVKTQKQAYYSLLFIMELIMECIKMEILIHFFNFNLTFYVCTKNSILRYLYDFAAADLRLIFVITIFKKF